MKLDQKPSHRIIWWYPWKTAIMWNGQLAQASAQPTRASTNSAPSWFRTSPWMWSGWNLWGHGQKEKGRAKFYLVKNNLKKGLAISEGIGIIVPLWNQRKLGHDDHIMLLCRSSNAFLVESRTLWPALHWSPASKSTLHRHGHSGARRKTTSSPAKDSRHI